MEAATWRVTVKSGRFCKHRPRSLDYISIQVTDHDGHTMMWYSSTFDAKFGFGAMAHFSYYKISQKVRVDI